jgi:hypothetical protein
MKAMEDLCPRNERSPFVAIGPIELKAMAQSAVRTWDELGI